MKDYGLLLEALMRARRTVICVTYPGSAFHPMFKSAHVHYESKRCSTHESTSACQFASLEKIVMKEAVSFL